MTSRETFFVRCPRCHRSFDYLLAEPVFNQPLLSSSLLIALCPVCMTEFNESALPNKKQIGSTCWHNLMAQVNSPSDEDWPWAVTCGITLRLNFGDFQAALRYGMDLPQKLYGKILEGKASIARFPGGLTVSSSAEDLADA